MYLTWSNLVFASPLEGANLADAVLGDANLEGANLQGANVRGANLEDVNLKDVIYNWHTHWPEGFILGRHPIHYPKA